MFIISILFLQNLSSGIFIPFSFPFCNFFFFFESFIRIFVSIFLFFQFIIFLLSYTRRRYIIHIYLFFIYIFFLEIVFLSFPVANVSDIYTVSFYFRTFRSIFVSTVFAERTRSPVMDTLHLQQEGSSRLFIWCRA